MKNVSLILVVIELLYTGVKVSAQFPDFTRIDTGVIPSNTGYHISSGWFDMDNDGDMDVIITNSSGMDNTNHANLLYKNEREGYFRQVTNTDYTSRSFTVGTPGPFGDIDNDGDIDIIGTDWIGPRSTIYKNDGYGDFRFQFDINQLVGVTNLLMDLNNDSYLDLIQLHQDTSRLYINDGTGQYSEYMNLNIQCSDFTPILHNASLGDADNDGDFDLYIGYTDFYNYLVAQNAVYQNLGNCNFERISDDNLIVIDTACTPSINWVDYDNDGDMDLCVLNAFSYISDYSRPGKLFENKGGWVFEEHIVEPDDYLDAHRNSSIWGDLDNDADLDLYITIENNDFRKHSSAVPHNLLLMNNGDGSFTEITEGTLCEESSHTATMEDIDNDGDLDVLLVRFSWANNGNNNICINEGNTNSWIILTCIGKQSNRTAFGTRVLAKAVINGDQLIQTREITPISGHVTYPSNRIHFGMGDAELLDSLFIRWPSGHIDTFVNIKTNQFYRAIEDSILEIDFAATSYVRLMKPIPDLRISNFKDIFSCDLSEYFAFVPGDTLPEIEGDTLTYTLLSNSNPEVADVTLEGNTLTVQENNNYGISFYRILASAGFTSYVCGAKVIVDPGAEHPVLRCNAVASSYYGSSHIANYAIDGLLSTRWGSEYEDNQWLKIELDTIHSVAEIVIHWESAFAEKYKILTSLDDEIWDTVYYEDYSDGDIDTILFNPIEARYVQILCLKEATEWGFSIWECEVYSTDEYDGNCNPSGTIINNNEYPYKVSVYPNPTAGILNIQCQDETSRATAIEIMDIYGRVVYKKFFEMQISSLNTISLYDLANGIYFLKLNSSDYTIIKKVIKMK